MPLPYAESVSRVQKAPCQAVIIRYAADPSRGEQLNIGVLLYAPDFKFLRVRFVKSWTRITNAFPTADAVHLAGIAAALTTALGALSNGQLALGASTDVADILRSAVPADDASLVHSPVISGVTSDPLRTLDEPFARYVEGDHSVR